MPWDERRQLAQALGVALAGGDDSEAIRDLVAILAGDPKWEVRGDIAGLLHALPEGAFERAVARLSEDDNGFVRRAAQRAMDRRRRVEESARRNRQGREHLRARLATLERLHGKAVADRARQVAEQMFDELMGALVHEMRGVLTPLKGIAFSVLHPARHRSGGDPPADGQVVRTTGIPGTPAGRHARVFPIAHVRTTERTAGGPGDRGGGHGPREPEGERRNRRRRSRWK